jgi:hypothetical protein
MAQACTSGAPLPVRGEEPEVDPGSGLSFGVWGLGRGAGVWAEAPETRNPNPQTRRIPRWSYRLWAAEPARLPVFLRYLRCLLFKHASSADAPAGGGGVTVWAAFRIAAKPPWSAAARRRYGFRRSRFASPPQEYTESMLSEIPPTCRQQRTGRRSSFHSLPTSASSVIHRPKRYHSSRLPTAETELTSLITDRSAASRNRTPLPYVAATYRPLGETRGE